MDLMTCVLDLLAGVDPVFWVTVAAILTNWIVIFMLALALDTLDRKLTKGTIVEAGHSRVKGLALWVSILFVLEQFIFLTGLGTNLLRDLCLGEFLLLTAAHIYLRIRFNSSKDPK